MTVDFGWHALAEASMLTRNGTSQSRAWACSVFRESMAPQPAFDRMRFLVQGALPCADALRFLSRFLEKMRVWILVICSKRNPATRPPPRRLPQRPLRRWLFLARLVDVRR